jgi:hypothetical protein
MFREPYNGRIEGVSVKAQQLVFGRKSISIGFKMHMNLLKDNIKPNIIPDTGENIGG